MINISKSYVSNVIVHNLPKYDEVNSPKYSHKPLPANAIVVEKILSMVSETFKLPNYWSFTHADNDFVLNPMYNYSTNLFQSSESFLTTSIKMAKLLYEKTNHPSIEGSDFFVIEIEDLILDDEIVNAILLIKMYTKSSVFDVTYSKEDGNVLNVHDGYFLDKPQKMALIINTVEDQGYKVLQYESSYNGPSQYWSSEFLNIKPYQGKYKFTQDVIKLTASFIKKSNTFDEGDPLVKSEILTKSKKYLEENENFENLAYADQIFQNDEDKQSFLQYRSELSAQMSLEYPDSFEISPIAVKNQARVYKSVIKLDKNFHIYAHGDHSKISKGTEVDGRKYYKLYYENES
jgi:hypothetical protein